MIVISASMPRSASLWYLRMTNDIVRIGGYERASDEYLRMIFGNKYPGNFEIIKLWNVRHVMNIDKKYGFVKKTHQLPNYFVKKFLEMEIIKATYVYRDPRDVIVSALELGKKMREAGNVSRFMKIGPYRNFARLHTVKGAVLWMNYQLFPRWKSWMKCSNILPVRYESLVTDTSKELGTLASYLNLEVTNEELNKIVLKYQPDSTNRIKGDYDKPHRGFMKNKGVICRYKEVLTEEEIVYLNKTLSVCLREMGY